MVAIAHDATRPSVDSEGLATGNSRETVASFCQVMERNLLPELGCVSPSWGATANF